MGLALSSPKQDQSGTSESSALCCFGSRAKDNPPEHIDHVAQKTDHNVSAIELPAHCNANDEQPQHRPEMEASRIQSERSAGVTTSGHWFASVMEADADSNSPVAPTKPSSLAAKDKKRSRSQAFSPSYNSEDSRPKTAPEQNHRRLSLLSWRSPSPLPDFSKFHMDQVIPKNDRLSWVYLGPTIPRNSHVTPAAWPLPEDPSLYPTLQTGTDQPGDSSPTYPRISIVRASPDPTTATQLDNATSPGMQRHRAKSEPFQHARGAKKPASRHDSDKINEEIRELQYLVEARRAASGSKSPQFSERLTLARSESGRRHVPVGSTLATCWLPDEEHSNEAPLCVEEEEDEETQELGQTGSDSRVMTSIIESTPAIEPRPVLWRGTSEPLSTLTEQTTPAQSCILRSNNSTTDGSQTGYNTSALSTPRSSVSTIPTYITEPSPFKFPSISSTPPRSSPTDKALESFGPDINLASHIECPPTPQTPPTAPPRSTRARSATQKLVFPWSGVESPEQSCRTSLIDTAAAEFSDKHRDVDSIPPPPSPPPEEPTYVYHVHGKKSHSSLKAVLTAPRRFVENL